MSRVQHFRSLVRLTDQWSSTLTFSPHCLRGDNAVLTEPHKRGGNSHVLQMRATGGVVRLWRHSECPRRWQFFAQRGRAVSQRTSRGDNGGCDVMRGILPREPVFRDHVTSFLWWMCESSLGGGVG